jgi:hypothetical protein
MPEKTTVKKSVSMPLHQWRFVDKYSRQAGHGQASKTLQQAIAMLMKKTGTISKPARS